MKLKLNNDYDAIVIGSGIGGLTSAAILSRAAGMKVLVLERHYEIGGLSHKFRRGPFSFDVGLHHVGHSVHKALGRNIFHFITDGEAKWNRMDEIHERFVFPDFTINVPASRKAYQKELIARFPIQKKAIKKYFRDVNRARRWLVRTYFASFLATPAPAMIAGLNRRIRALALMTVAEYLDANITDAKLKAVLVSRWGDYGLPPSAAAFCIHSLVDDHYMDGGYFPDGGAERLALNIEKVIEQAGGCILTSSDVQEIVVENGQAVGVRYLSSYSDNRADGRALMFTKAPIIISGTGAWSTYNRLLPKSLDLPIQQKLGEMTVKYGAVSLYLGLKESVDTLGQTSANLWIYDAYDFDAIIDKNAVDADTPAKAVFLSFPSMKNGKNLMHTAVATAFMPCHLFDKWKNEPWKQRAPEYYDFKEQIAKNMLALIEKKIPGFTELIAFRELATPPTVEHFSPKKTGALYGLPSTPERFASADVSCRTDIKNLYLSGADAGSLGIMGALLGGVAAASVAMGRGGFGRIMTRASLALRSRKRFVTKRTPADSPTKMRALVTKKEPLATNIFRVTFQAMRPVSLAPGQHVKVEVAPNEWRAYSLAEIHGQLATLIVDTRHGGPGANFMAAVRESQSITLRLPATNFKMPDSHSDVLMFSTGVGISLILSIFQELTRRKFKGSIRLYFGAPNEDALFVEPLLEKYRGSLEIKTQYCVDAAPTDGAVFHGTVVDAFKRDGICPTHLQSYVCGNPFMVQAVIRMLQKMGATQVFW